MTAAPAAAAAAPPQVRPALSQHAAPLLHAARVETASATARWHCPGHQGGARSASDLVQLVGREVLAADVWVETATYQRVRAEAEDLAAQAWGAGRAWLLGNGSTAGNLAWLLGSLDRDDEVVVARDVHVSVLAGLTMTGARPVWVLPEVHDELGLPLGVAAADVDRALAAHPGARHVVVTGGRPGVERALERARALRHRLGRVRGLRVLDAEALGLPDDRVDPLKVIVDVTGLGRSGWDVDAAMRRLGAPAEGADAERVFLVVPAVSPDVGAAPDTVARHLDGVVVAIERIAADRGVGVPLPRRAHESRAWRAALRPGEQVLTPGRARWAPVQRVPLGAAVGRIAAEPLVPYPPGIPAVVPGERITGRAVRALRDVVASGGHVHGCADPSLATVAVVAD